MPEGDTIYLAAKRLREALAGNVVTAARPLQLQRFVGKRVVEVEPEGKHLFIVFENGLQLHTHMRMNGTWDVYQRGERL